VAAGGAPNSKARRRAPLSLFPEIIVGLLRMMMRPPRVLWRRGWLYRRLLKGKLTDHIVFHPYDATSRRLEDADALLRGRFRFAGEAVDVTEGSIFEKPAPSQAWLYDLHSFAWLPPLAAAGGEAARTLATNLISQWLRRNQRYSEPAWAPDVIARRLINIFAHGRLALANSDVLWRSKLFVSLREQARLLARIAKEAPPGIPRLEAAAGYALSGACLDDERRLQGGLARLQEELAAQILPDGGHVSRAPEMLVEAYRLVVMVCDALTAIGRETPQALRSAHDRMAPMVRFFRHGDGGMALFNGSSEGEPKMVAGLLARDEVRGQPFVFAPHSGYQRMVAGRVLTLLDCGVPPKGVYSSDAHAGCLAFEFSSGSQRVVVNCGAASDKKGEWEDAMRATAAHSTITLDDTSMAGILTPGLARDLVGARLLGGPKTITTNRMETSHGWTVEASHDGYVAPFGFTHERALTLAPHGVALTGRDRLIPAAKHHNRDAIPFSVRFHIHPEVRVSTSQSGDVLLKLPNGDGWRFRCAGGSLSIEESIYLGTGAVRRSEQLVITGALEDEVAEIGWIFEQYGMS
jgi:uncharacterized heparinase superfamily protein